MTQIDLDAVKAALTDDEALRRFDAFVAVGRRGWGDPLLMASLLRVRDLVGPAAPGADRLSLDRVQQAAHAVICGPRPEDSHQYSWSGDRRSDPVCALVAARTLEDRS